MSTPTIKGCKPSCLHTSSGGATSSFGRIVNSLANGTLTDLRGARLDATNRFPIPCKSVLPCNRSDDNKELLAQNNCRIDCSLKTPDTTSWSQCRRWKVDNSISSFQTVSLRLRCRMCMFVCSLDGSWPCLPMCYQLLPMSYVTIMSHL